jgi:hypothetical protein
LAFTSAISSLTWRTGIALLTVSTWGEVAASVIGAKSLTGS